MIKEFFKVTLYQPLFNLLVFFAWLVPGHSIGWAIILLTAVVRLLLWVPSVKALKAPLMMRQYQDEIKALQERHKEDKVAQSQALMAFYKAKGINPLSGCLPILIQLPVIFILYRVFITGLNETRPDLVYSFTPHLDTINTIFFGIDLSKPERFFLPVLAGLAQFAQSFHMSKINPPSKNASPSDPATMMSKQMVYLFPAMTVFIALSLPAGLALYWTTSTIFGFAQQLYVARAYKTIDTAVKVTVREKAKPKR